MSISYKFKLRQQSRHLPAYILLLLTEAPLHGGALQSALKEKFPVLNADSASVYRTLQQLEKNDEVVSEWDTSGKGAAVRIYKLTKSGWDKLDFWKSDIQERIKSLEIFLSSYEKIKKKNPRKI